VIVIFSDSRLQRLLNVWHSIEDASSTHPLTSGVRYSNQHADGGYFEHML